MELGVIDQKLQAVIVDCGFCPFFRGRKLLHAGRKFLVAGRICGVWFVEFFHGPGGGDLVALTRKDEIVPLSKLWVRVFAIFSAEDVIRIYLICKKNFVRGFACQPLTVICKKAAPWAWVDLSNSKDPKFRC